jgi:hypothetical protein
MMRDIYEKVSQLGNVEGKTKHLTGRHCFHMAGFRKSR